MGTTPSFGGVDVLVHEPSMANGGALTVGIWSAVDWQSRGSSRYHSLHLEISGIDMVKLPHSSAGGR